MPGAAPDASGPCVATIGHFDRGGPTKDIVRRRGSRALTAGLYEAKTIVAEYPFLALPIARRRGHGEVLDEGTEIVIEGYPRAASSFAVAAFRSAQGRPVRIAHHVHAPAQLIAAARRGTPALALLREPEGALISHLIRSPQIPIRSAARGYARFYEPLLGVRGKIVTATFDGVVGDFGAVIRRVNERFGTTFVEFDHTEENVSRLFEEIDADYRTRMDTGAGFERAVPRPSELRSSLKEEIRARYRSRELSAVRGRLERLYARLVPATTR
jgi:hypothetical protein